jgi:endonuclease-3
MKSSKAIIKGLDSLYPDAKCELVHHNNFELLIAVVLSAQTTDERVNSVTPILFEKYPDARNLMNAKLKDVENIIRPIGLYHNKAINIIKLSKELSDHFDGEVPDDREALESLPGVGRKTANVVLNNCFDYPAFAVDTHVSRVSKRLGIAEEGDDPLKIEKKLMDYFPKKSWGKLHHQFIFFGRYKCKAIKPDCNDCPFRKDCNYLA